MKRLLIIVIILITSLSLVGCGNRNIGVGNFQFNYAYVLHEDGNYIEYEIKSWQDYDDATVEVTTKDGNSLLLHNSIVILSKNKMTELIKEE